MKHSRNFKEQVIIYDGGLGNWIEGTLSLDEGMVKFSGFRKATKYGVGEPIPDIDFKLKDIVEVKIDNQSITPLAIFSNLFGVGKGRKLIIRYKQKKIIKEIHFTNLNMGGKEVIHNIYNILLEEIEK